MPLGLYTVNSNNYIDMKLFVLTDTHKDPCFPSHHYRHLLFMTFFADNVTTKRANLTEFTDNDRMNKILTEVIDMYSNAKISSLFAIILGAMNMLMAIALAIVFVDDFRMGFAFEFAATIFLITNGVALLLLGAGLRSATTDLTVNDDSTQEQIRALKKKVDELEAKVKYQ